MGEKGNRMGEKGEKGNGNSGTGEEGKGEWVKVKE
jgi:hypothetical protein